MRDFDKDTEGDSRPLYTRLADAANGRGVIVIGFDTGFAADRASAIADNRHADHCSASDWGPPAAPLPPNAHGFASVYFYRANPRVSAAPGYRLWGLTVRGCEARYRGPRARAKLPGQRPAIYQ
jgi:hypothetical protein